MASKFLPSLTLWWRDRWGSPWTTKIISTSPASSPTMSTSWLRTGSWTESCWTRTTESKNRGPSVYRSTTTDSSCVTAPASNCANYSLVQRDVTRILTSCSIAAWGTNWWFGSKDQLQHSNHKRKHNGEIVMEFPALKCYFIVICISCTRITYKCMHVFRQLCAEVRVKRYSY